MGHSYRDMPPRYQIAAKIHGGKGRWWRVIERRPRPGDFHPLSSADVDAILHKLPLRFTYGLTTVELRSRAGALGDPFGWYRPKAKSIIIYSVPEGDWLESKKEFVPSFYEWYQAQVTPDGDQMRVTWTNPEHLKFFVAWTLLHECGHHYDNQYRCRRPYPDQSRDHEDSAEAHAYRMARQTCIRELFPHIVKDTPEPPPAPHEAEQPA